MQNTLTAYVGFSDAQAATSRVQVKGAIDKSSVEFDHMKRDLRFDITDDAGKRMTVHYAGTAPGNFDQASHAVCAGTFENGVFNADELLIKCPSKYQGEDSSKGTQ